MSVASEVEIIEVLEVNEKLVSAWAKLMPQLSTQAGAPDARVLREVLNTSRMFMAVTQSGEYTGSVTLVVYRTPAGRRAHIDDIVVDEQSRGLGLGKRLTRFAIEEAEKMDVRSIELSSKRIRVAANKLYESLGFEKRDANLYRYNKAIAEELRG